MSFNASDFGQDQFSVFVTDSSSCSSEATYKLTVLNETHVVDLDGTTVVNPAADVPACAEVSLTLTRYVDDEQVGDSLVMAYKTHTGECPYVDLYVDFPVSGAFCCTKIGHS